MIRVSSYQIGTTAGAPASLASKPNFPDGQIATRLRHRARLTLANAAAMVALTISATIAAEIIAYVWSSMKMGFGDQATEWVDVGFTGRDCRILSIAAAGDDARMGLASALGTNYEINALGSEIVVPGASSLAIVIELSRPFLIKSLAENQNAFAPGASQMRQIQFENVRGSGTVSATAGADLTITGNIEVELWADTVDSEFDPFGPVIRMSKVNAAAFKAEGPDGLLVFMGDDNAAAGATALTLVSVKREGDASLHEGVDARTIASDFNFQRPLEVYNIANILTPLAFTAEIAAAGRMPTGRFSLEQLAQDVATLKPRWIFIPQASEKWADAWAGPNLVGERQGQDKAVKLSGISSLAGLQFPANVCAHLPLAVLRPGDTRYTSSAGRVYVPGNPPVSVVPPAMTAQARAIIAQAPASGKAAALEQVSTQISKSLPGGQGAKRSAPTAEFVKVARKINVKLAPDAATARKVRKA